VAHRENVKRSFATMLGTMEVVQPAFTQPGFRNAWVVFTGWVLTMGVHAVTQALVVTDVARRLHHERFHRFFSRGAWSPDAVGRLLFMRVVAQLCPQGRIVLALDDTLVAKKGPEVFGIGSHLDPAAISNSRWDSRTHPLASRQLLNARHHSSATHTRCLCSGSSMKSGRRHWLHHPFDLGTGTSDTPASPMSCGPHSVCCYTSTFLIRLVVSATYTTSPIISANPRILRSVVPPKL
jgi:hypothetical protein